MGYWPSAFPHTVVFFTVLTPFSKRSCHKKPLSIGSYSKSFGNDDVANTDKQNSETIPVISDQTSSICPLELRVFETFFTVRIIQSSLICASSERRSQAQNAKLQIFADAFPQNLFMTIYYNLFFLQAHYSQICARRHKILLMTPGVIMLDSAHDLYKRFSHITPMLSYGKTGTPWCIVVVTIQDKFQCTTKPHPLALFTKA